MRLLERNAGKFRLTKEHYDQVPPYAILSHRWGNDADEIQMQDLDSPDVTKPGYKKLEMCFDQAEKDGLDYIWVDTCCIDKTSSADLDKNINSMFRYYQQSTKCYAYLSDIKPKQQIVQSQWFTRGWTLQELIAPKSIDFFTQGWEYRGSRRDLEEQIHNQTDIPVEAFGGPLSRFSRDERMQWIRNRKTKVAEDRAYCMLGIFNVSMRLDYSEGEDKAFARLERKIKKSLVPTLQTIDNSIREYYLSYGRLDIQRLSGKHLPMGSCFINVSIVDSEVLEEIRSTLSDRLKTKIPESSKQGSLRRLSEFRLLPEPSIHADLTTLFESRQLTRKDNGRPKRILIWGKAGMGKTTVCKKMVYDFYRRDLWQDLYDRVFWLPLRQLKLLPGKMRSTAELVQKICFRGARDALFPLEQLNDMFDNRCLFILDGLDEVSSAFDPDSPMYADLRNLLSQEHVIITSRPHSTHILNGIPLDLRLETVGFAPDQVEEYLNTEGDLSEKQISDIKSFFWDQEVAKDLAQIPVQLDAICYVWSMGRLQPGTTNMTALYRAISDCLWRKDLVRLHKKFDGRSLTPEQVEICTDVRTLVDSEASRLEQLAFTGLCHDVSEFDLESINGASPDFNLDSIERACKSSFLRSSDDSLMGRLQTHHFIHLTFQEFFAARYLVRHLRQREMMRLPRMKSPNTQSSPILIIDPVAFVGAEKYNTRFDIFWGFVAGSFSVIGGQDLLDFFKILEAEPLDLLGLKRQKLLVRCMHQVDITQGPFGGKAREIGRSYSKWAQLELQLCGRSQLLQQVECPIHTLERWLQGTEEEKSELMKVLIDRPSIPPAILVTVMEQVAQYDDGALRDYALVAIAVHSDILPEGNFSDTFVGQNSQLWLEAVNRRTRYHRRRKSQAFVHRAFLLLLDEDVYLRCLAARCLRYQADLPISTVEVLVQMLEDRERKIRHEAANVLRTLEVTPKSRSSPRGDDQPITQLLKHRDPAVLQQIAVITQDDDVLKEDKSLSQQAIEALIQLLHCENSTVRVNAIRALAKHHKLPDSELDSLADLLQHQDPSIRREASVWLVTHGKLRECKAGIFMRMVLDPRLDVQMSAIELLSMRESLSECDLQGVFNQLQYRSPVVWVYAATHWDRRISISKQQVDHFIHLLRHEDNWVRSLASDAIQQHKALLESQVEKILELTEDPNPQLQTVAAATLAGLHFIPESYLGRITDLLRSKTMADQAFEVLVRQANFAQLIFRLDEISLQNLIRSWLRTFSWDSPDSVILYNEKIFVEVGIENKQWTMKVEGKDREDFRERWTRAQLAVLSKYGYHLTLVFRRPQTTL